MDIYAIFSRAQLRVLPAVAVCLAGSAVGWAQGVSSERPVRVSGAVMMGLVQTKVQPGYPQAARVKGVSGDVDLYVVVGSNGSVEDVAPIDGPELLQEPAKAAVRAWKYKPYLVNGQPVTVETTVRVSVGDAMVASTPTLLSVVTPASEVVWAKPAAKGASAAASVAAAPAPLTLEVVAAPPPPAEMAATAPVLVASASAAPAVFDRPAVTPSAARAVVASPKAAEMIATPPAALASAGPTTSAPGIAVPVSRPIMGLEDEEWKLAKQVAPVYPEEAADDGVEGTVVLRGVVTMNGSLRDLKVIDGPEALRQAALDAAAKWIYEPRNAFGGKHESPTMLAIDFHLQGAARVKADVMAGRIENLFVPDYPPQALAAGVTGTVTLHARIDKDGFVREATAVAGPEMLRATAEDAVLRWKYLPYVRNGAQVDVETMVVVAFSIPK